jgi:hypothetical protein
MIMDVSEMITIAERALAANERMILTVPRPFKNKPKGFPKGELLCEQPSCNVISYEPKKILAWLKNNDLYDSACV